MRSSNLSHRLVQRDPWPTPTQLLLLRACLESGAEARAAWEQWNSIVDLDHLDYQSCYLLPMLDKNLWAIGVTEHPWLSRIKGYRRYIWAKNRRLLNHGSRLIEELRSLVGDELLVIKGAALASWYYSDPGLRPMEDFDFMIKPESLLPILNYLKGSGWKVPQWFDRQSCVNKIPRGFFRSTHSYNMRRDDGIELDLHWNLMGDLCGTEENASFWDGAVSTQLPDGSKVCTLEPSHLLFHCSLHSLLWSPVPPTRWIVDAVILLRGVKSIRWRHLIDLAERFRYTLRLGTALKYLASTFPRQANIPQAVIHCLLDREHSVDEIGEFEERMRLSGNGKYFYNVFTVYRSIRVHSTPRDSNWLQEIWTVTIFLMNRWELPNVWLVFVVAPFRAVRRIYRNYFVRNSHA
jgi:hypothetical protein